MSRIIQIAIFPVLLIVFGCGHSVHSCNGLFENYRKMLSDKSKKSDTILLISTLAAAISEDSECIDAHIIRGDLFFSSGANRKALADYKKVNMIDPNNEYALYKLGLVYQEEEIYDSSIYFLQAAINFKTHEEWVVDQKGVNSNLETKEEKYDVTSTTLFYNLGISQYYNRNLPMALNDFNFCIRSNYRLGKSYFFRGAIYEESNKRDSACKDFMEAKLHGNSEVEKYIEKYCK